MARAPWGTEVRSHVSRPPPQPRDTCSLTVRLRAPTPCPPLAAPPGRRGAEVIVEEQCYPVLRTGLGLPFPLPPRGRLGPPPAPTPPLQGLKAGLTPPQSVPHPMSRSPQPGFTGPTNVYQPLLSDPQKHPRKLRSPSPCLPARPLPHPDNPLPTQLSGPVPTLSPFLGGGNQAPDRHSKLFTIFLILTSNSCFPPVAPPPKLSTYPPLTIGFP